MGDLQQQYEWYFYMRERPIVVVNGFPVELPINHPFLLSMAKKYGAICIMRPGSCESELSMVFARKNDALYAWSRNFEVAFDAAQPEKKIRCYMGRTVKYLPPTEQFDIELSPSLRHFVQPQANIHGKSFLPRGYLEGDPEHVVRWQHANPLARPPLGGGNPYQVPQNRIPPPVQALPLSSNGPAVPGLSTSPGLSLVSPVGVASRDVALPSTFQNHPSVTSSRRPPLPPQELIAPQRFHSNNAPPTGAQTCRGLEADQAPRPRDSSALPDPSSSHSQQASPSQHLSSGPSYTSSPTLNQGTQSNQSNQSLSIASTSQVNNFQTASSMWSQYEHSRVAPNLRSILDSVPIMRDLQDIFAHNDNGDCILSIYKLKPGLYWTDDRYVRDKAASYFRETLEFIEKIGMFQHHSENGHWTMRITYNQVGVKDRIPHHALMRRAGGERDSNFRRDKL